MKLWTTSVAVRANGRLVWQGFGVKLDRLLSEHWWILSLKVGLATLFVVLEY